VLSTFPAIATALCGVLTGEWLQTKWAPERKIAGMFVVGIAGVIAGEIWGYWFPINKNLWTSSYVLFTAGGALICLAICCWLTDLKLHRGPWSKPFLILGTNAITAYILSQLIGGWFSWDHLFAFQRLAGNSPALGSLLHSLLILLSCFLPVWWMYRKKILLKV
jgi:predicted acyltransferase